MGTELWYFDELVKSVLANTIPLLCTQVWPSTALLQNSNRLFSQVSVAPIEAAPCLLHIHRMEATRNSWPAFVQQEWSEWIRDAYSFLKMVSTPKIGLFPGGVGVRISEDSDIVSCPLNYWDEAETSLVRPCSPPRKSRVAALCPFPAIPITNPNDCWNKWTRSSSPRGLPSHPPFPVPSIFSTKLQQGTLYIYIYIYASVNDWYFHQVKLGIPSLDSRQGRDPSLTVISIVGDGVSLSSQLTDYGEGDDCPDEVAVDRGRPFTDRPPLEVLGLSELGDHRRGGSRGLLRGRGGPAAADGILGSVMDQQHYGMSRYLLPLFDKGNSGGGDEIPGGYAENKWLFCK